MNEICFAYLPLSSKEVGFRRRRRRLRVCAAGLQSAVFRESRAAAAAVVASSSTVEIVEVTFVLAPILLIHSSFHEGRNWPVTFSGSNPFTPPQIRIHTKGLFILFDPEISKGEKF